jgi:pyruvate dehydrogenase E2 component (dihydrolipoamide acetyltransferase)
MATGTVKDVVVPDIGDFEDVPVIEVLVSPGDTVEPEQPLVTLESDKATMDVPAPFAGTVHELKVKVGDRVSEGSAIMTIAVEGNGTSPPAGIPTTQPAPEAGAAAAVETATVAERSAVAGDGAAAQPAAPAAPPPAPPAPAGGPVYASPSVRRLAHTLRVDLSQVKGTGRKDRILKEDVEAFAKAPAAPAGVPAGAGIAGLNLAPWPQVDFEKFGPIERVPLSRIKKISGPALARNWVMIPHVTHNDDADITELEAFRKKVNEQHAKQGVKVTMVALMMKSVIATLKAFPEFNASLDGDELVLRRYYNIGFAADTPQGLVVPVIKNADEKGIIEIAKELGELSATAREGKLKPGDMQGGTFTISSLGGIGGTSFTPIINAPEVAILGVTRSAMRPVWDGKEFKPRLMVPLSLSYDHRIIDGAAAARFTVHLAGVLSDMRQALL